MPLDPDEPVVIIGAGGLGLTAIAVLRYRGHENICAVDVSEANLKLAQELGATHVVTSGEQAAHDIREAAGGPASAVIDFVNNGATATLGFKILTKAGRMVQVGLFGGEVTLPTAPLALRMIRLEGSFVGTVGQMKELVEIAKTGDLPSIPIEERPLSASSVAEALDDLTAGNVSGRIVLTA
ncbi:MAG TPA: zinc-binding dehydrogenase [Enteractinococcus sp.]